MKRLGILLPHPGSNASLSQAVAYSRLMVTELWMSELVSDCSGWTTTELIHLAKKFQNLEQQFQIFVRIARTSWACKMGLRNRKFVSYSQEKIVNSRQSQNQLWKGTRDRTSWQVKILFGEYVTSFLWNSLPVHRRCCGSGLCYDVREEERERIFVICHRA